MSFLRLLKAVVPTKYETPTFEVDVMGLVTSGLARYICFMTKGEIRRHIMRPSRDVTGAIIIIGGIGIVDGFATIQRPGAGRLAVTIFELRNAQHYIHTSLDKFDKNKHGAFKRDSFYGRLMGLPDSKVFDGKDHH